VFKGGILLVSLLVVLVVIWIAKTLFAPIPGPTSAHVAPSPVSEASEMSTFAPAASVAIVAIEPVRIKVVRKSDGVELYQGALQTGERREYPNVPIYLTATDLGAVELEYKGHRYPTGHTGHERIQFDFSTR
jgi:hypothetical protein